MFVSLLPIAKTQITTTNIKKRRRTEYRSLVGAGKTEREPTSLIKYTKHRRRPALMTKAIGCSYHSVDLGFIPIEGTQPGYPTA